MAVEFGGDIRGEQAGRPEPEMIPQGREGGARVGSPVLEPAGLRCRRIDVRCPAVGREAVACALDGRPLGAVAQEPDIMPAPGQTARQGQLGIKVAAAANGDKQIPHLVPHRGVPMYRPVSNVQPQPEIGSRPVTRPGPQLMRKIRRSVRFSYISLESGSPRIGIILDVSGPL